MKARAVRLEGIYKKVLLSYLFESYYWPYFLNKIPSRVGDPVRLTLTLFWGWPALKKVRLHGGLLCCTLFCKNISPFRSGWLDEVSVSKSTKKAFPTGEGCVSSSLFGNYLRDEPLDRVRPLWMARHSNSPTPDLFERILASLGARTKFVPRISLVATSALGLCPKYPQVFWKKLD